VSPDCVEVMLKMVRTASMRHACVMSPLPSPIRAYVGLIATVVDEARRFPDKAFELPMLAVSTALQASLRAQQRYAQLTARGDEVLTRTPTTDEPPPWATFDEPVGVADLDLTADEPPRKSVRRPRAGKPSAFDAIGDE
jgi:CHASE2 domain-containing sensor protein